MDGLRALAVSAVVVYHMNPAWLPGGFFGVDVFFVVSGYLITCLLIDEWQKSSMINLTRFWARRARRLLPALIAMLLGTVLLAAAFAHDAIDQLRTGVPAALGYFSNWWLIFHRQSYFQSIGRPPLLLHLWSLAVEEQFYLLWPLVVLFLLRRSRNLGRIRNLAVIGALASTALMAVLYHPSTDPSRVYFGLDTHAQGLLIGAALAVTLPPWRMRRPSGIRGVAVLDGITVAGLIGLAVAAVTLGQLSPATYRGGFLLVDLCAALAVVGAMHPYCRIGGLLGRQPLLWIGMRSYAIYLWHWPIVELTRPNADIDLRGFPLLVLRLALIGAAAELSWRFVEIPWRAGAAATQAGADGRTRAWWSRRPGTVGAVAGTVAAMGIVLAVTPVPSISGPLATGATPAARQVLDPGWRPPTFTGQASVSVVPDTEVTTTTEHTSSSVTTPATAAVTSPTTVATTTSTTPTTAPAVRAASVGLAAEEPILGIGDSVMLAASEALAARFPGAITVDAAVSRQVDTGLERLAQYRSGGQLGAYRTVVIDLGTNGTFTPQQFAQLVALTAGVPNVVVYDVHVDRPWAAPDNATLVAGVAAHPGMRLADWNTLASHPGLLYDDGIHPNAAGAQAYATLLYDTLVP
jgi:peptidoglycan/LPS O-acetylase OafA/YrhL